MGITGGQNALQKKTIQAVYVQKLTLRGVHVTTAAIEKQ
jgi:hypothetical protein